MTQAYGVQGQSPWVFSLSSKENNQPAELAFRGLGSISTGGDTFQCNYRETSADRSSVDDSLLDGAISVGINLIPGESSSVRPVSSSRLQ